MNKITELENMERLTEMRLYEIHKEKDEQQSLLNGLINKKLDTSEIEKQKIIKRFKINENIKANDKAKNDVFYGSSMYPPY